MSKEHQSADYSSSHDDELLTAFQGQPDVEAFHGDVEPQLLRTQSVLRRTQTKLSFFNEKLKGNRKLLGFKFVTIYMIMGVFVLGVFSIYWGSFYERETRFKNLRMLVVIEDDTTINGVEPVIGNTVRELLQTPAAKSYGKWLIQNNTEFNQLAASHGNTVYQEIQRQVHHQKYWSSIYVRANATANFYEAIVTGNTAYNVSDNSVVSYYETGRDIMGMSLYVTPQIEKILRMLAAEQQNITLQMFANANLSDVFTNVDSVAVVSSPLNIELIDGIPFTDYVLTAPSQVGLIYMIIVTFFAFNFFGEVHQGVAKMGVKPLHLVLYRVFSTIMNFFVISFFYSMVTLAFQVDFTGTFGRSGWLVYWMTNFLTMWAVGAMNETMAMLCIMTYPPLMGFWMLFWVISNISATFSPIALTPHFYRFGYAMPIHAAYEITKVILLNTYKGALGRNYGILIAWCVIATISMVLAFKKFGEVMGKRAMADRKAIEEQVLASREQEFQRDGETRAGGH